MATLRTEEEKSAILAHCLELERTGGDILGYLCSQNYLTPRATWCNYQREWLWRKPYQYTDGKPKKKKERTNMSRLVITEEQKAEAVRIAIEGKSPFAYLKELGAKSPNSVWHNIKSRLDPETLAKIPKHPTGWKAPKVDKGMPKKNDVPTVKISGPIVIDAEEAEKVKIVPDKQKITKPVNYDGFDMIGVKSKETGFRYEYSQEYKMFHVTVGLDSLDLHVSDWKRLLDELQKVIPILGVEL